MAQEFRVRFKLSKRLRINADPSQLSLASPEEDNETVILRPRDENVSFGEADELVLMGGLYESAQAAETAADQWTVRLRSAFARLSIGADFGARGPTGLFTNAGLRMLEEHTGHRMLNDVHGAMVFDSEPVPRFVKTELEAVVGKPGDRVVAMVKAAARLGVKMTERQQLAYDLFSASFSEASADARFVLLMMAVETLIEPRSRGQAVVDHVDRLISSTRSSSLPSEEIESIAGSLRGLYIESIGQAGKHLARTLGDRRYADESPEAFFRRCYQMRSDLVHGRHPRPGWSEVNELAAPLERFVGDLLSGPLLDEPDDQQVESSEPTDRP
jgi:hypothetical protein